MTGIYAFDDCSILNTCEIKIPISYRIFFDGKEKLYSKNYLKLKKLIGKLNQNNIDMHRFVPSNMDSRIVKVVKGYTSGVNLSMLRVLESELLNQIEEFKEQIISEFKDIEKNQDIIQIEEIFRNNVKLLVKDKKVPETEDMEIISGYYQYNTPQKKYLISADEHFWGYKDIILTHFKIIVVEEWFCDKLSPSNNPPPQK